MQRLISATLALAILLAGGALAQAQADAGAAYQKAKTAYAAGRFAAAADLAKTASQTDGKNPEVFLLLGKAHYQLGQLDDAIAAWRKVLSLAPEEPFARRMLDALRAENVEVGTRIKLVELMIQEKLFAEALREAGQLLGEKAVAEGQRAKIVLLQAEAILKMGRPAETLAKLHHLRVLYPKQFDAVQTLLLEGQAKLQSGGAATAEGMDILRKLVADSPVTPAAATARYALIAFELQQDVNPARARALAKWLADSPEHPQVGEALRKLIEAYLSVTRKGAKPTPEAELTKWDVDALALVDELYRQTPQADEATKLTELLIKHLDEHYARHGAYAAAVKGAEISRGVSLPRASRLLILRALAGYKTAIATRHFDLQARTGKLPPAIELGNLPEVLTDVTAIYRAIDRDDPANPPWSQQVALATAVRAYAAKIARPIEVVSFKGPDAWTIDLCRPVIEADADAAAVKAAVDLVEGVIKDYEAIDGPEVRLLAAATSRELVAKLLSPRHAAWPDAMQRHAQRLDGYARYQFNRHLLAGAGQKNAELSDVQKELVQTLQKLVAHDAQRTAAALKLIAEHVQLWTGYGHWAAAEQLYAALAKGLSEDRQRQVELAVIGLWIDEVAREHARLSAAGLTVPKQLDPRLQKALERCYRMQAGLTAKSTQLAAVRTIVDRIVNLYKALDYREIAEAAILVKSDPAVEVADEYAAFQLVLLKDEQARIDLERFLKQYAAKEKIELGPEFKAVIAGWTDFIAQRPTGSMVSQATERIFGIGRLFEQKGAFAVAAGVYGDLAKFAAGIEVLAQAAPGGSSTVERAAFSRATALDFLARKVLAEATARRTGDDPPPAKLSDEFTAAIAAYRAFIEAYPDSPLVSQAISKIMSAAYEYAKIDAWEVADSVYADLLASELDIRRPERLKFARGLCQLGRAMPGHARQILSALTSAGLRGRGETSGPTALAMNVNGGAGAGGGPAPAEEPTRPVSSPRQPPADPQPNVVGAATADSITVPARRSRREAQQDSQLLAMIRNQESNRAAHIAQLRDRIQITNNQYQAVSGRQGGSQQQGEQQAAGQVPAAPVLSEAELARQEKALSAAYEIFQGIRKDHPLTTTAEQARAEILVMVGHWRTLGQWQRSAALAMRFLTDNPTDGQLAKIRLEIARDRLTWAAQPIKRKAGKQELLTEVRKRFDAARAELAKVVADFPEERSYQQQAQWDIATSFRTQARVIAGFSPTLARGQYVRTTKELRRVAERYPDHPKIGTIPQMLWEVSAELTARGYFDEAILVWNELTIHDPMHALAQQAALRIAQTYQNNLERPLLAAQAYQELNFARGGNDQSLQDAIFQIGTSLKAENRWVEALHVLETFVDSFPRHPQAGQALTTVGQIHQTNEAWEDAIAAYRRVMAEFKNGQWSQDAKWAIAECTINLSQWRQAADSYRAFVKDYPDDSKVAEANRRIEVLKSLARYQGLVDEEGQRKAFDAQYQIAAIVATQLSNPVKAIIEYRKVAAKWPKSHLADDALYAIGTTYLSLGETEKARDALLKAAAEYPASPLADDALFMVGKSFEDEASKLTTVTRGTALARNKKVAQRRAYEQVQENRLRQQKIRSGRIASLKQAGKGKSAEVEEASAAGNYGQFNDANVQLFAYQAARDVETLTATQLADRQDKINAALRKAVGAYNSASKVAGADKADDALLQVATIFDQRLKDSQAAMQTWKEIVRQFSGTSVAEDASWRIAQYQEREGKYAEAIEAYKAFLRNYRPSPKAGGAQFAIAENYEHLDQWVAAMDSYTNYINNFADGPLVKKAKEQINWIKTYRL